MPIRQDETYSEQRGRINRQAANQRREQRIRVLRELMREGYQGSTPIRAILRDLENGTSPVQERIGRGFTA